MERRSFVKGAATIAFGGFVAKLIGALYRIPLLSLVGGEGMGLYQLVYPFYCLLLTLSATGIPSSIAKLTAERNAKGTSDLPVLKTSLKLFSLIGLSGSLLMILLSSLLSSAQGAPEARGGYTALAPSVLLTSAISVFRGFFQGRGKMRPTALSEISEQLVKVAFGLVFAYLYRGNLQKTVTLLLLSVTLSEGAALLFMLLVYRRAPRQKPLSEEEKVPVKTVLALCAPVTLASAILPLCSLLESVLVVRLMRRYASDAVALYGLFTGGAVTLVNLPVSLCYGVAAASVPTLSAERANGGGEERLRKKMLYSLFVTLLVALPCAVGLYFFAAPATKILYRGLTASEREILVKLVKTYAASAVFLSCAQTLSACLTGLGSPKHSALSMTVAAIVRLVADVLLVRNPKISVFGAAIAANIGYLVAFFLDLLYNIRITNERGQKHDFRSRTWRRKGRFDGQG